MPSASMFATLPHVGKLYQQPLQKTFRAEKARLSGFSQGFTSLLRSTKFSLVTFLGIQADAERNAIDYMIVSVQR